ncbi:hypothetical protein [Cellulomonas endophytica]|uniref:hypothetical protein n=1 Tax=Cellulomonas endophytica TaxID=2494735 RepID=UPI001011FD99|nr:hypothetical protein [Cellulomonas endophytica]
MTPPGPLPPPLVAAPGPLARRVVGTLLVTAALLAATYGTLLVPLLGNGLADAAGAAGGADGGVPAVRLGSAADAPPPLGALVVTGWALTAALAPLVALAGLVGGATAAVLLARDGRRLLAVLAVPAALTHGAVLVAAASPWGQTAARLVLG